MEEVRRQPGRGLKTSRSGPTWVSGGRPLRQREYQEQRALKQGCGWLAGGAAGVADTRSHR